MPAKRIVLLALVAALATAAPAGAVTNTYEVDASVSPLKAGKKKRPVPVGLRFAYRVGERDGLRPAPVLRYRIVFAGLRVRPRGFARCSAARINRMLSDRRCPARSLIGTGTVDNIIGSAANPADRSLTCHLKLRIHNAGRGRLALFLAGSPSAAQPCIADIALAIPARFVRTRGGIALQFTVPASLRHPIPTLDNSVVDVSATIKRVTRRAKRRRVGFFESVGGCRRGRRAVSVVFTDEAGQAERARTKARCRR